MQHFDKNVEQIDKEITDLQMIGRVISSLFPRIPISMYHNQEQTPVQIISADPESVTIKGTDRSDDGIRILTFTNNFSLYHFWFELGQGSNREIEYLKPIKMVIREDAKRTEARASLSNSKQSRPYILNIIPEENIFSKSEKIFRTIEGSWKRISLELLKHYNACTLKITGENDLRYKIFRVMPRPIFLHIPEKMEPFNTAFFNPYQFKELLLSDNIDRLVGAEITLPIYLKKKILLGYLKVTHSNELGMSDFNKIQGFADTLMQEINNSRELIEIREKIEIGDISSNGIGFSVPYSLDLHNYLKPGNLFIFDLLLDKDRIFTIKAISKFLSKQEDERLRIGAEFYEIGLDEKAILREYSKNIKLS